MRFLPKLTLTFLIASMAFGLSGCEKSSSVQAANQAYSSDFVTLENTLNARLNDFEVTFENGNLAKLFDFMPPKVLNKILKSSGVSRTELDQQVAVMWAQTLETVEVGAFTLDKEANGILTLSDGRPYQILPTTTSMRLKVNDSEVVSKSETLAFVDSGEWYVVRLDEAAQVKIFRDAYPEFDAVEVMAPIMTMDGVEVKQ